MILHLKSPNVICINQQSDLLMYMYSSGQKKGGYSRSTLYHTSKWKGHPSPPPAAADAPPPLLMYMYSSGQKKGGYSRSTLYHTSKWKGHPSPPPAAADAPPPHRDFNTIKYIKIRLFFAAPHPLLQNGAIILLVWAN